MNDGADGSRQGPSSGSRASSPRSSTAGKAYASRGEARRQYATRLPEATYEALMDASAATGVSANALITEAIDTYLVSDALADRLRSARVEHAARTGKAEEAARRQREAIAKLAGG